MVRDYRDKRKPTWIPGRISRLLGATTSLVDVGGFVWKRHFNQLKKRSQDAGVLHGIDNRRDNTAAMLLSDGSETEEANTEGSFHSAADADSSDEHDREAETHEQEGIQETQLGSPTNVPAAMSDRDHVTNNTSGIRVSTRCNKGKKPARYCS